MSWNSIKKMILIMQLAIPVMLASVSGLTSLLLCTRMLGLEKWDNLYVMGFFLPIAYFLMGVYESIRVAALTRSRGIHLENTLPAIVLSLSAITFVIFFIAIGGFLFFHHALIKELKILEPYQRIFYHFSIGMLAMGFIVSISTLLTSVLYGIQKTYSAMWISMLASALVLGFTYLISYQMHYALQGYEAAIFLAYSISASIAIFILQSLGFSLKAIIKTPVSSLWTQSQLALKTMIPVGSSFILVFVSLFCMDAILAHFNASIISGFGIAYRFQTLTLLPAISIGTAMSILPDREKMIRAGLILSMAVYIGLSILIYFYREGISRYMTQNLEIAHQVAQYFKAVSLSYAGNGPWLTYLTFLEQSGRALLSLGFNFFYFLLVILLGFELSRYYENYHFLYNIIFFANSLGFVLVFIRILKERSNA